ncbi:hypothetical protein MMC30_008828 [Trapelia coarctata]|nr:hypothetical protein [Trapelia coarctata]
MPIGIQRLNARHLPPTPNIIFIKPLPGPTAAAAEDFLSRVAAISHPILREHHLSIMTLEEYEPNPEFIGRNFNAGEVIQLVLKTREGGWLSFRSVVMVMMHELAHCVQMNHSGAFWKVRNAYAEEMRGLWARGYTGEGVWGRGVRVGSGEGDGEEVRVGMGEGVRGLCGGTYRSGGGRKRKRKAGGGEKLTYAERQQRRIARKFGVGGVKVGDDEETRVKLEDGKRPKGKPRVAGSKRGRELRAAAALARFGEQKEGVKEEEGESESESDYEDEGVKEEARDLDGSKLLDSKGHGMIKVCEDEDTDDVHVKEEMQELQDINNIPETLISGEPSRDTSSVVKEESSSAGDNDITIPRSSTQPKIISSIRGKESTNVTGSNGTESAASSCPICSMTNEPSSLLCMACSHVLDLQNMPGYWRCKSSACNGSLYVNAADCGLCGACGGRKPND